MMEKSERLERLRKEVCAPLESARNVSSYYLSLGYRDHYDDPATVARGWAFASLMRCHKKYVYENDLIPGSIRGIVNGSSEITDSDVDYGNRVAGSYGFRTFWTNTDHYAPDYEGFLRDGISGTLDKISLSLEKYKKDEKKVLFLQSTEIAVKAFRDMVLDYKKASEAKAAELDPRSPEYGKNREELLKAADVLNKIAYNRPKTFREALQLMWLCHTAFYYEGRYAMALGRMDQFLYPFYRKDIKNGTLTPEYARELICCTLYKIREQRLFGGDNVVNIAIGGLKPDGKGGVNELSYIILDAVGTCQVPGPNLSARLYTGIPKKFVDCCLEVIGTGLGYPALMNDNANIPALARHGYDIKDARNYCMVGCIENFMQGKQPPWSDGRYNTPKYLELALNDGVCMMTGARKGPSTGNPENFTCMDDVMKALETQMRFGASEYMMIFRNENERYNKERYTSPFLSVFCRDCIGRGLDINNGGAVYPSVHGAGCMGIGTMADSLAAIETVVFRDKEADMKTLCEALRADFKGYEWLQAKLLAAPKYGNNNDIPDKYAVWFVNYQDEIFSKYRTWDGGAIYTAIASNVSNIPAGLEIAATPDGRNKGQPVSDAASPTHGRDICGSTSAILSLAKPDYTKVSCGTVVNQKYSPAMFATKEKRKKLAALITAYFSMGGQEVQINSVSRDILKDAIENPEKYSDLVVRVSGFSAYYNSLSREVKEDILERTEHA